MDTPLIITAKASKAIREVMAGENVPDNYRLRVGMQGGGCGGMAYLLGFDEKKENDLEYTVDGIPLLIDRAHSMYVLGMEIDWHEDEYQRGFVFNNPKARQDQG